MSNADAVTISESTRASVEDSALSGDVDAFSLSPCRAESMRCSRCFHIVGEHLLCRHHDPDFKGSKWPKEKPKTDVQVNWSDLSGPEWDFLESGGEVKVLIP